MKKFIYLICTLFFLSCSSGKFDSKKSNLNDPQEDLGSSNFNLVELETQCKEQDITAALKSLSSQYTNYKEDPTYWNLIGSCFLNDMKPLKARLFFLRAIEEDKFFAPALNNLGVVYWQMDKHYEALAYFKRAEQIDRSAVAVKYNLARLYSWYGLHKSSEVNFSQLDSKNLNSQDYNYIATNYAMLGQFENAVKNFKSTKQLNNKFQAVYAYALKNLGQKEDAAEEWRQAKITDNDLLKWLWILGE